jgi:flagellar basal-body rod protein FlgF
MNMDRMLYIGMSGAKQHMQSLTSVGNNLANVSTTGFREDMSQFRSMPVFGPGLPTRAYAMTERPGYNFQAGPIQTTGRDLDVAIQGEGWIAIQSPDGGEAYTRAGDLRITPAGQLVNGSGHPILGNAGPITIPPSEKVEIATDGTISIRPIGQNAAGMVVLDRIKLVNPNNRQMTKGADGLMRHMSGQPQPVDARVKVLSGALEGSNVNAVTALVDMINLQRNYELQVKAMHTADQIAQTSSDLMRIA